MPCPKKGSEALHQDLIQKEFSCFSAQAFSDGFHPALSQTAAEPEGTETFTTFPKIDPHLPLRSQALPISSIRPQSFPHPEPHS